MADEVITRIISELPPERFRKVFLGLPADRRQRLQIEGMQKMLSQLLQTKFGQLSQEVADHVQQIESEDELSNLAQRLITASSLAELGLN